MLLLYVFFNHVCHWLGTAQIWTRSFSESRRRGVLCHGGLDIYGAAVFRGGLCGDPLTIKNWDLIQDGAPQ